MPLCQQMPSGRLRVKARMAMDPDGAAGASGSVQGQGGRGLAAARTTCVVTTRHAHAQAQTRPTARCINEPKRAARGNYFITTIRVVKNRRTSNFVAIDSGPCYRDVQFTPKTCFYHAPTGSLSAFTSAQTPHCTTVR